MHFSMRGGEVAKFPVEFGVGLGNLENFAEKVNCNFPAYMGRKLRGKGVLSLLEKRI